MKRLLFFLAFMTLGTGALIQLLVTEPQQTGTEEPAVRPPTEALVMNDVNMRQLEGEHLRWELVAQRAVYDDDASNARMTQVSFRIYPPPAEVGADIITGRSAAAELDGHQDHVVLSGQVVLQRGSGLEITSERIEYDDRAKLITSPGPVRVRSPQGVQEGDSLSYSIAEDRLELTRPVFYQ